MCIHTYTCLATRWYCGFSFAWMQMSCASMLHHVQQSLVPWVSCSVASMVSPCFTWLCHSRRCSVALQVPCQRVGADRRASTLGHGYPHEASRMGGLRSPKPEADRNCRHRLRLGFAEAFRSSGDVTSRVTFREHRHPRSSASTSLTDSRSTEITGFRRAVRKSFFGKLVPLFCQVW